VSTAALFGTTASRDKGNGASDGQPKRDFGTGNHSNRRAGNGQTYDSLTQVA
jgi:hypothetical protein